MTIPWRVDDNDLGIPEELQAGVYASVLSAWYTPNEFTLDFGTAVEDDPDRQLRGVARVKVPPGGVFEMIRILHGRMTEYEGEYGPIHYPEPRAEDE